MLAEQVTRRRGPRAQGREEGQSVLPQMLWHKCGGLSGPKAAEGPLSCQGGGTCLTTKGR